jgi:maltose-binding protein MalE
LSFLRDLTSSGKYRLVNPSLTDPVALGLFVDGKAAMYIGGSWNASYFTSFIKASHRTYTFATAPLPSMGSRASHPLADLQVFVLNRYSSHPNESLSLLAYMTAHMQLPEYRAAGWIPVLRSDLATSAVQSDTESRGAAQEALYAEPVPNLAAMGVVWGPMNAAVGNVARAKDTPAHAAHQAVTQIRRAMAQAHL